jgi:hypothetical protein
MAPRPQRALRTSRFTRVGACLKFQTRHLERATGNSRTVRFGWRKSADAVLGPRGFLSPGMLAVSMTAVGTTSYLRHLDCRRDRVHTVSLRLSEGHIEYNIKLRT